MKVLVDTDNRQILGAAVLGLHVDEVAHSLLDVMSARKPYTAISPTVHVIRP